MAVPQPLADELKKAGLPEPDLHEHLRQNEEMWQLFFPEYYNNGKQLPPIEENRRKTQFMKGRGRKAAAPGPARGTKRQRTAEPTTQQALAMPTSVQAPAMPRQQQQTFENMQSHDTQQFFANLHSSGNQQRVRNQTGMQTEDDHRDRTKKRRTGPAGYDEQQDAAMMDPTATSRGSFVQQLNHQQRGNPSTRPSVPTSVDRRRQQNRAQQHEQVAQVVSPGWNNIVGTAMSDEWARQAQKEATSADHQLRDEVSVAVPAQQDQPLLDDEQWADFSSSPVTVRPMGDPQGQSDNLGSGSVDDGSSSLGRRGPYSSPIRLDLMAMGRVPIGGAQWQADYIAPTMHHGAVDLNSDDEVQHLHSSPPAAVRAEVDLREEPEIPEINAAGRAKVDLREVLGISQIPSSPLKSGLNDSGYFPGGLVEGNDDGSGLLPQDQDDNSNLYDFDLSQVSNFNLSYTHVETSDTPEGQTRQSFEVDTDGSGLLSQNEDDESNKYGLSRVSQFSIYSQGQFATIPDSSVRGRQL